MKNYNLFLGFGLILIAIAAVIYLLLEDSDRNALISGALAGLGFISALMGLIGKRTK
ncbi:hypothetical protein [uncultured Eudoraea sp.]|uniref:hypothetical protein n=1 Tax=uncultured Eudoraea sp. TaxID=1035614 RepID=UPI00262238A9|nr:hypothetical protein [uncultured Eudoraea sp.]